MKYLFVHQNFPGQFLHLVMRLRQDPANDIVFISEPNENFIGGVRNIVYRKPETSGTIDDDAMEFEIALKRARVVQEMGMQLKGLGFIPDIIIGHQGWGEMLNLQDVWPDAPVLGYHEFYYRTSGFDVGFDPEFADSHGGFGRVRAKNAVNLLALNNPGHGQTPTLFQLSTYPAWAQPKISVLHEGVNLHACRPKPSVRRARLDVNGFIVEPGDLLVTYVSRDLEPYRGFHTLMRALPRLLRHDKRVKVVMVGGDEVSYGARLREGTWRDYMLAELAGKLDLSRICFPGKVPYAQFLHLLQRSDAHVYLTYPFVLSWSLREALACGCAIAASDTAPVREVIADGQTGLLTRFPDPDALADTVLRLLEDRKLAARLRRQARQAAEATLDMEDYLARYQALIAQVVAGALPA